MIILGIESSCDDTAAALLDCSEKDCIILSEETASQIKTHKKYGGVVPEIAGRLHAEKITPLLEAVLKNQPRPDAIAVTGGPGLITGLIVGVEAARALSYAWDIPLVRINHIEGHIHSVELSGQRVKYPALALIVSGGHTELIFIEQAGKYKKIGATHDDAAGECFDKVAKLIGLPYPGGPSISRLAAIGNAAAIKFPRPMIHDDSYDFSFSGLKTAALYWLREHKLTAVHANIFHKMATWLGQSPETSVTINDFCASLEQAITDVLTEKTAKAINNFYPQTVILAGGVAANKKLRAAIGQATTERSPAPIFLTPELAYCMDNGAMIAAAGYHKAIKKDFTNWRDITADPNWEIA